MTTKKIAVLHDAFLYRGGGERLVTLMAKALDADLISGFFSEWSFVPEELGFFGQKIALGKPVFKKWIRHLILKNRFHKAIKLLKNYETIILSGNCLDVLRNFSKKPNQKIFYYCHTPPRYLFDFREMYLQKFPKIFRPMISYFFDKQAKKYIEFLDKIDQIFTNSQNTHDRLLHFCGKNSEILYPPTDTTRFSPADAKNPLPNLPENYYLSFSRLSPPKRVGLVVDAFLQMPDKNLVFTYGKNDPLKEEILEKCQHAKNIFPIPAPNDDDFIRLVQNAIANIYIPIDEDFGMSPVESMACGVPVIGVNEWGLKETVINGKTGVLLPAKIQVSDIIAGVQKIDEKTALALRENCVQRAEKFSLENFIANLKKFLEK